MKFADEKQNEKLIGKSAQEHESQRSCSNNQQFVSQVRAVVDAGLDEQFMSGNPIVFSELISKEFHQEYSLMNALFYQVQDCTLEEYILSRKIEKVKEGLVYTVRSLSEIALALDFKSEEHLVRELRRHTGYAPDHYTKIRQDKLLVMDRT